MQPDLWPFLGCKPFPSSIRDFLLAASVLPQLIDLGHHQGAGTCPPGATAVTTLSQPPPLGISMGAVLVQTPLKSQPGTRMQPNIRAS